MEFKREDVRLDQEIDVVVHTIFDEDGIMMPAVFELPMKVLNISATGISVSSEREFNEKVSFYLDLPVGEEVIKVMPVIVRKIKGKGKEWIYGCKFIHLELPEEQIIRKYIFECELNKRKMRS